MIFSNEDTDWATSTKGNRWRRLNGTVFIVGESKYGGYWARVGEDFLKGSFASIEEAQAACEETAK